MFILFTAPIFQTISAEEIVIIHKINLLFLTTTSQQKTTKINSNKEAIKHFINELKCTPPV